MRQLDELTAIVERLNQTGSFKDAADLLTEWAREFTGCDAAALRLLLDGEGEDWLGGCSIQGASEAWTRDETVIGSTECLCGRVTNGSVDTNLPFFTEGGAFRWGRVSTLARRFSADDLGDIRGRCISEAYESVAIVPVRGEGRIIGSLHLADSRPDRFDEHMEVLESVCRLAGDTLLRYRDSERDHTLFDRIQAALLPARPPRLEAARIGVDFRSATETARLGGDFYDVIDLDEAGILVLVGDVCGNGIEAAGLATRARYTLEARARTVTGLASLMDSANTALLRVTPPDRFITVAACLIEPHEMRVRVCLAGHPPPLLLSHTGCEELRAPHNPPLGVLADARFEESAAALSPGDVLVVYTDGVTESRRTDTEFGTEGICTALQSVEGRDPQKMAAAVCSAATDHHDEALPADDRLVMAIRLDRSLGNPL
jgi:serine phosphatase RsbU (regulator of sigma subunit)